MAPHKSFFSYNLTKPYPFKWFTPVVLCGFVAATALFSFLNLITNGYYLVNEVSVNPNATTTMPRWIRKMPSFFASKVQATCQPTLLSPQDVIFTNQTALTYTINSIARSQNGDIISSLEYYNNVFENCSVSNIDVNLQSFDRLANQVAFSQWGPLVRTYVSCTLQSAEGSVVISMTHAYDYEPDTISLGKLNTVLGTGFLARNLAQKPSLWWGESLMSWYWIYVAAHTQNIRDNQVAAGETPIRKGILSFSRNEEETNVASLDYFKVNYRFSVEYADFSTEMIFPGFYNETNSVAELDSQEAYPNIWVAADSLAKSVFWTILTDLGQTSLGPNILTDRDLLAYFTANFSLINEEYPPFNALPGPAKASFDPQADELNDTALVLFPSVVSTSYLCQIPKTKSTGNLLMSILVADLIFLQALWKIYILVVDTFILKEGKEPSNSGGPNHQRSNVHERWEASPNHSTFSNLSSLDNDPSYRLTSLTLDDAGQSKRRPGYHRQTSSQYALLGGGAVRA